jgi:glycosyltransferase involved in cell wall biosynthesis
MQRSYRILIVSTLPLAAPWNLADKNLAATLVQRDRHNQFIVHTNQSELWPSPPHVTAIRSRLVSDRTTEFQKLLSFMYLLRQTTAADLIHIVATLQGTARWVGPLLRTWARLCRCPVIHTAPSIGDSAIQHSNLIGDVTVVVSEHTKQRLERAGVTNVFRVYPPLDPERIRPKASPAALVQHYNLGERAVLYPAHYGTHSGIEEMIHAFATLPAALSDSVLVFACRAYPWQDAAVEAAKVMAQAEAAGVSDRVRVVGTVNDLPALMSACAVTALVPQRLASKMDLPYVFLEALVLDRPVILSDAPPICESLLGDGGLAVRYGDIDALRDALVRLLSDSALRQRLAAQGKAAVLEYCHPDRVVKQYQDIYQLAYALNRPDTKFV